MVEKRVEAVARKIERIEIQGASNIARAALDAICGLLERKNTITEKILEQNCRRLLATRPTEPMMRNAMQFVLQSFRRGEAQRACESLGRLLSESRRKIASLGSGLIKNDSTLFTHCHSSTIIEIFRQAKLKGKKFKVICTETRPLFQGHRTVKDLTALGIPVTLVVDSAANFFMPECDLVLVGCDAFVPEGLVNKIGTSLLALSAHEQGKPFYCALSLLKFAKKCEIEERSPSEISREFEKMARNPAFDLTPAKYVTGGITEVGILRPRGLGRAASRFLRNI